MAANHKKIIIAPDSFKGSLSAAEVAEAIERGILRAWPDADIETAPLADGGEGTTDILVKSSGGRCVEVNVQDPLGRDIQASYGILGDGQTCVIEVAAASGLTLLAEADKNPLRTTSFGTGQLLLHALDAGYRRFIVGLGGSAVNDGGAGILRALGARFLNQDGDEFAPVGGSLDQIRHMDLTDLHSALRSSTFSIACDVNNPLVGERGASAVFGPQKGADAVMVSRLDRNLQHYADMVQAITGISVHAYPGAGAAGGVGAMFRAFTTCEMISGIDLIMRETGLEHRIQGASLVMTGEGRIDGQTAYGKAVAGIARCARKYNVPVIVLAGSVGDGWRRVHEAGIDAVFSIVNKPMSLDEAMAQGEQLLEDAAEQIMNVYRLNGRAEPGGGS